MKFPIFDRERQPERVDFDHPESVKLICCRCRKDIRAAKPTELFSINAGAILMDESGSCGGPPELLSGFLTLGYQSAHASADMVVVSDVAGGQFDLDFCSAECMRGFFDEAVSALEKRIECNRVK